MNRTDQPPRTALSQILAIWDNAGMLKKSETEMGSKCHAYSLVNIKSIDDDKRIIEGTATTPSPDRVGDIVVPQGAKFELPIPLLLDHDHKSAVGSVEVASVDETGITFRARIAKVTKPGALQDLTDQAWELVKTGLRSAVSIGFRVLDGGAEPLKDGGVRFNLWEWLELSLVSIPAQSQARITGAKSMDPDVLSIVKSAVSNRKEAKLTRIAKTYQPKRKEGQSMRQETSTSRDFVRMAIAMAAAGEDGRERAREIAAARWGPSAQVANILKAPVAGGATGNWGSTLVNPELAATAFFDQVRSLSVIGQLSALRKIPMRTRTVTAVGGSTAYWTAEGKARPISAHSYTNGILDPRSLTAVTVVTDELLNSSEPDAEETIRRDMVKEAVSVLDSSFTDPAITEIPDVRPASVTAGVAAITATSDPTADLKALVAAYNGDLRLAAFLLTPEIAVALSGPDHPELGARGGLIYGINAITSHSVPAGLIILLDPTGIAYGQGDARIAVARHATIEMADDPTGDSTIPTAAPNLVSLWQTSSVAIKLELETNWDVVRSGAVNLITGAAY